MTGTPTGRLTVVQRSLIRSICLTLGVTSYLVYDSVDSTSENPLVIAGLDKTGARYEYLWVGFGWGVWHFGCKFPTWQAGQRGERHTVFV